jgi:hypothetical protein
MPEEKTAEARARSETGTLELASIDERRSKAIRELAERIQGEYREMPGRVIRL